jgi:hypothetical protein
MKHLFLILVLFVLSCDEEPPLQDNRTSCEKALDHIFECVGYRPYLKTCDEDDADKILSTPCSNIKDLWR